MTKRRMPLFPFRRRMCLASGNVLLAISLGLLQVACDAPRDNGPRPGAVVNLDLPSLDGPRTTSAAWRGKTVVLNVWASWCAPCREEMASLEALARAADPDTLIVVGLTVDTDRHLAREYLLRERIGFAMLSDPSQDVAKRVLGVHSLPTTLVLAPDGTLRAKVAGAKNWTDPALLRSLSLPALRDAVQPAPRS